MTDQTASSKPKAYKPRRRFRGTVPMQCRISANAKEMLERWAESANGMPIGWAVEKLVAKEEARRARKAVLVRALDK